MCIRDSSHPDNALEVCGLLTPLHIVPEWYFLCQYANIKIWSVIEGLTEDENFG